jgi:hypothetical protein
MAGKVRGPQRAGRCAETSRLSEALPRGLLRDTETLADRSPRTALPTRLGNEMAHQFIVVDKGGRGARRSRSLVQHRDQSDVVPAPVGRSFRFGARLRSLWS